MQRRAFLASLGVGALGWSPLLRGGASGTRRVVVVGAGLSGLACAHVLVRHGVAVSVLEARERVGGRVLTLDDIPGHPEGGANVIGPNYGRVIDAAERHAVPLRIPPRGLAQGLLLDGKEVAKADWPQSPQNPLPDSLRQVLPSRLVTHLLRDNPLVASTDWCDPRFAPLDVSAAEYFSRKGLDADALALIDANNSYGNTLRDTSLLSLLRVQGNFARAMAMRQPLHEVSAGNMRLPEALAEALPGAVHTASVVRQIRRRRGTFSVVTVDGQDIEGDAVVCALPLPALRRIEMIPAAPAERRRAESEVAYHKVTQAHFLVSEPYWESSGRAPGAWTDGPLGRVFVRPIPGDSRCNLTLWINGNTCDETAGLSEAAARERIEGHFYAAYPEAREHARLHRLVRWADDPYSGGAWAVWSPGQIGRCFDALRAPRNGLFFAGEHTAAANPGMEGAMESGERAALEVMRFLA